MNDYSLEQSILVVDRFLRASVGPVPTAKIQKLNEYRAQLDACDPGVEKRFRSFCQRLDIEPFSVERRVLRSIYNRFHGADWGLITNT